MTSSTVPYAPAHTSREYGTPLVTQEQHDRCPRYIDVSKREVFYKVQSESEPTKEYEVRALKRHGHYYTTCTCQAGQQGIACKHVRWAKAHAKEYYRLREAATSVVARWEERGAVYYNLQDETGHNLVRLGRLPGSDYCYAMECLPLAVPPCHHLRVARGAEKEFHEELAHYKQLVQSPQQPEQQQAQPSIEATAAPHHQRTAAAAPEVTAEAQQRQRVLELARTKGVSVKTMNIWVQRNFANKRTLSDLDSQQWAMIERRLAKQPDRRPMSHEQGGNGGRAREA